jgi:glycosyltransferase involved in cell wall biosynthesis
MNRIAVPGNFKFNQSGLSTIVYRNSLYFKKDIVYDYIGNRTKPDAKIIKSIEKTGGSFTLLKQSRIPLMRRFINFISTVMYLKKNQYKICYINVSNAIEMLYHAITANIAGVPIRIGHSHNSNDDSTGIERYIKCGLHFLCKPLLPLVLTDYLTCSDKATDWMYPVYVKKKKKIIKIKNSVDIDKYHFCNDIRNKKRLEMNLSNKFIIGHVGRFSYQKNHIFILQIFKEILRNNENVHLFLIGEGPLYRNIVKKAEELGIADDITFYGPTTLIHEFMQVFDAFLLPSRFEGLPLVGIEAQCTGLPCFLSDSITQEMNVTGNCHFLSLKDPPELWAKEIIRNSYSFIRKDCSDLVKLAGFSIERSAETLENFFIERINDNMIII